jgi:hypothetical protein
MNAMRGQINFAIDEQLNVIARTLWRNMLVGDGKSLCLLCDVD